MQALQTIFADVEKLPTVWAEAEEERQESETGASHPFADDLSSAHERQFKATEIPGLQLAALTATLTTELGWFLKTRKLGLVLGKSASYRTVTQALRHSDVSFIAQERLPEKLPLTNSFEGAPDLAVEVISPTNTWWEILEKMDEYFASGCRLVWLISPKDQRVQVYRNDHRSHILRSGDSLEGEDVLPGFTLPVAELFANHNSGATAPRRNADGLKPKEERKRTSRK